ncbi:hypothetical protein BVIET440_210090 [Burkholderia vietnamiensis]
MPEYRQGSFSASRFIASGAARLSWLTAAPGENFRNSVEEIRDGSGMGARSPSLAWVAAILSARATAVRDGISAAFTRCSTPRTTKGWFCL